MEGFRDIGEVIGRIIETIRTGMRVREITKAPRLASGRIGNGSGEEKSAVTTAKAGKSSPRKLGPKPDRRKDRCTGLVTDSDLSAEQGRQDNGRLERLDARPDAPWRGRMPHRPCLLEMGDRSNTATPPGNHARLTQPKQLGTDSADAAPDRASDLDIGPAVFTHVTDRIAVVVGQRLPVPFGERCVPAGSVHQIDTPCAASQVSRLTISGGLSSWHNPGLATLVAQESAPVIREERCSTS